MPTETKLKRMEIKNSSNNCFLAVDVRDNSVLASVEYFPYAEEGTCGIYLYGFDKKIIQRSGKLPNGNAIELSAIEIAQRYLMVKWRKWVPSVWCSYYVLVVGGGAFWPNKLLKPKVWHKDTNTFYSHYHKEAKVCIEKGVSETVQAA